MDVPLRVLLIVTGLTGIHSITTVSRVSVKAGDSISIPCLYDSQYVNHVKYLCKGRYWSNCDYAIKTNQRNSKKFSIADDKTQRIFTVTVNHLTDKDTHYWCAVEINSGGDVGVLFHLSVTRGTPSLTVDHQEITGFKGHNITINCNYSNPGEMKWCRLGRPCVTTSSGSIDGTTINASGPNVFTVTMSGLKIESSGWYQCVKGDFQMPVHVTVTVQSTTTTVTDTSNTLSPTPEPLNLTSVFAEATPTTAQGKEHSSDLFALMNIIIALSVLFFTVMVTLFIWFMLKRHKQTKSASSAMPEAEEEVTYSDVKHTRKTSSQRSTAEKDVDVTYSSVVSMRQLNVETVEANDENVTYSTLAKH